MKRITLGLSLGIGLLGTCWFISNSRAATETPAYEVVKKEGTFEIRRYPTLSLVRAAMSKSENNNSPFGKLFRFISGDNEKEQKIAMTAPVLIDRTEQGGSMSFIVPKDVAAKGAPTPKASDLTLSTMHGGKFAILRFPGWGSREEENKAMAELRTWVKSQGLNAEDKGIIAYYDPPWTPPMIRRNEVLIPLND